MSAKWMVLADDRLLEYLEQNDPAPPGKIAESDYFHWSRDYLNKRLRLLYKAGLVTEYGGGVYDLAPEGLEYLTESRDLRDLEKPE